MVNTIQFKGNNVTKPQILFAELKIELGDTLHIAQLQEILDKEALRLYNLQLFHWVKASYIMDSLQSSNEITIEYEMQERWYFWPIPIFSLADRNVNAWIQKMNFERIDYGIHIAWYNFRGRNENFISNIQHGFNRKYEVFYRIPQINKKKTLGLDVGISHYQSHFLDYINFDAKPFTFQSADDFPIQHSYARIGIINRNTVENINTAHVELHHQQISDTVLALNPNYHVENTEKTFIQLQAKKTINQRKNFSYPISGRFFEIELNQKIFFNTLESNTLQCNATYSQYIPLNQSFYYGFGASGQWKFTNRNSTSENIALGFKRQLRGFDFYVIDGQHFITAKQHLAGRLANTHIHLNFIPSKKFSEIPLQLYLGPFVETGYVEDGMYAALNPLSNQLLYSAGVSLHAVSYYDQVFVLDYTLNSLGEHGIFVSTKFPF